MVADLIGLAGTVLDIARGVESSILNANEAQVKLDAAISDFQKARVDAFAGIDADRAALVERLRAERAARPAPAPMAPAGGTDVGH